MVKFKKGDKVKCINNEGLGKLLTVGNVYTIQNFICNGRDNREMYNLEETYVVAPYDYRLVKVSDKPFKKEEWL